MNRFVVILILCLLAGCHHDDYQAQLTTIYAKNDKIDQINTFRKRCSDGWFDATFPPEFTDISNDSKGNGKASMTISGLSVGQQLKKASVPVWFSVNASGRIVSTRDRLLIEARSCSGDGTPELSSSWS